MEALPDNWRRSFQKGIRVITGYVKVKREVRSLMQFFRFNLMDLFPFQRK
jgi:hypothetical protein